MSRNNKIAVYLIFFALLSACTADPQADTSANHEKQLPEKENESLQKTIAMDSVNLRNPEEENAQLSEEQPSTEAQPKDLIRIGQHSFTLQWIGWEKPGVADITLQENQKYKITGKQESDENDDYLSIDGELSILDEKTLLFEGELVSRVSFLNGGEPCKRQDPVHFKITGSRKYWRLQEKYNCEGDGTLDYIDIFF